MILKRMSRRTVLSTGANAFLSAPLIFIPKLAPAQQAGGLFQGVKLLQTGPAFANRGSIQNAVQGGASNVVSADSAQQVERSMSNAFPELRGEISHVYGERQQGFYTRFRQNGANACMPMWHNNKNMTFLEGPNIISLAAVVQVTRNAGYSSSGIREWCWPVRSSFDSSGQNRTRALIGFGVVKKTNGVWQDRDVLTTAKGKILMQYDHTNGQASGVAEIAIVDNAGAIQLHFEARYMS